MSFISPFTPPGGPNWQWGLSLFSESPASVLPPANPFFWYRPDSVVIEDTDKVATLVDKSGNGINATAAGVARPTLTPNALNGYAAVTFDGANNWMSIANMDLSALPNGISLIVVHKITGAANRNFITFNGWTLYYDTSGGASLLFGVFTGGVSQTTPIGALNVWEYVECAVTADGTFPDFYLNSNAAVQGNNLTVLPVYNPATNNVLGGFTGATFLMIGSFVDVLFYKRRLSAADRLVLRAYMSTRYGL